jgi:hypothetical protein
MFSGQRCTTLTIIFTCTMSANFTYEIKVFHKTNTNGMNYISRFHIFWYILVVEVASKTNRVHLTYWDRGGTSLSC